MKISDGISATFKAVPFMVSNGLLIWFLPAIFLTLTMSYGVFAMIDLQPTIIDKEGAEDLAGKAESISFEDVHFDVKFY